jgi:hypothetical protein
MKFPQIIKTLFADYINFSKDNLRGKKIIPDGEVLIKLKLILSNIKHLNKYQ